jgi:hypothetical protein
LDSKDVVYDVIIPSIFPQKGWKVIFNLKILKKTNLTLLLLHIVSNDIKTKETNYYSQCLFFSWNSICFTVSFLQQWKVCLSVFLSVWLQTDLLLAQFFRCSPRSDIARNWFQNFEFLTLELIQGFLVFVEFQNEHKLLIVSQFLGQ